MAKKETSSGQAADLRRQAEEIVRKRKVQSTENIDGQSLAETKQILHELQIHQIELQTQNEELRRMQAELDSTVARYFDLYDLAPIGYVTVSEKGLIIEANLTAATLLGTQRSVLMKKPLSRFILKEDQNIYYLYRTQILDAHSMDSTGALRPSSVQAPQAGISQGCELRMLKKDGSAFWAHLMAIAEQAEDSPLCRIVISDVTERKRIEEEKEKLEAQNRQLQKSESLARMAGAIAHHFNNQLCVVIGNLEMAIDEQPKGAPPSKSLTIAMEAAWKSAEMSNLMLTYLGQSFDKVEPLDLSYSSRKILPFIKTTIPGNVVMKTDFLSPGPIIMANTGEIQQISNNLITNALEAIGNNSGTISLSVKTASPAQIFAAHHFPVDWQSLDKDYACLEVIDTGCGIADKDIEQLFDPFFSSKFTGRGMGLAVVLGIVKAHNGVVTVESKLKGGSTFSVFFPLSKEALLQPQKSVSNYDSLISAVSSIKLEEGGTVLLVEDEEMLRNMVSDMLKSLGFSVLEAKDGVEAVELFRQHQDEIKFVLSDLIMPRMNGWETLTALRELASDIPVILVSGYNKAFVMAGDHPELPQAFLGKPYMLKELSDAISEALVNKKK